MSFTSLGIIRTHLQKAVSTEQPVSGLSITLSGTDYTELPDRNLVPGSDTVKWLIDLAPVRETNVTLRDYDWTDLFYDHLVPNSVIVTLSPAFDMLYVEERDYKIDYENGRIRRVVGGLLPDNYTIMVYYYKYGVFVRDTDYTINSALGRVTRIAGGDIPDGATLLIDYALSAGTVEDNLIEQAITEAEDIIVRALSADYSESSTDQGLQTGATELVLAVVARDMTAETLARWAGSDADDRARQWRELSAYYEQKAWRTLAPFLDPHALRSPMVQSRT